VVYIEFMMIGFFKGRIAATRPPSDPHKRFGAKK